MRRSVAVFVVAALVGASAPVLPQAASIDRELSAARTEAAEATKRLEALEAQAARAGDAIAKLKAERAAAAAAIEAAEARISEADAALRLTRAQAVLAERRLAVRRAPLAALLAGIATMGRQPPLLTVADHGSIDEIVRVKALLDATMPVIRQRTARLGEDLARKQQLAAAASAARADLAQGHEELVRRQQRFAELEGKASARAADLAGAAFSAGDRVLASGEALASAGADAAERSTARQAAALIAELPLAPARPLRGDAAMAPLDFNYSLPALAPLLGGFGSVDRAGIIARGIRLDTRRGAVLQTPADGTVLFAAPFRGQDGLVIIDHGNGWTSLLLGVASDRPRGTKVRRGESLGRALGPIGIELRRNGMPVSPALIAASSVPLSNGGNTR